MQLVAHPLTPKQHDAQKSRLKEEGRKHLIGHKRAKDWSRLVSEDSPVCAELVRHHNARYDTHAKGHREYFFPVVKKRQINIIPRPQPKTVQDSQITGQPD